MAPTLMTVAGLATTLAWFIGSVSAKGTLSLSLEKKSLPEGVADVNSLRKRAAGTLSEVLFDGITWSAGGAYYTNVTVGTPPQVMTVIVDTGSSDLYFDASNATVCAPDYDGPGACRGGSFNPNISSTYKVLIPDAFATAFGDNSTATGDMSSDTIGLGSIQLPNVEFGVATNTTSTTGFAVSLMGVGYNMNEAPADEGLFTYPNIPDVLQQAGVISSRLFSLYLNDLAAATGSILFGGIDTSLYTGELFTIDILPSIQPLPNNVTKIATDQYVVPITGVSYTTGGKTSAIFTSKDESEDIPALLDSGTSTWVASVPLYNALASLFPEPDAQGYIPCSAQTLDLTIGVEFAHGMTIQVPAKEFAVPAYDQDNNMPTTDSKGNQLCVFMITPDVNNAALDNGNVPVGDSVMRSMYIVYDMDNAQLAIAPRNTNPGPSNVVVVPAGPNGIASALGATAVSTAASNTVSIPAEVTASSNLTFSSVSSSVGEVTGLAAVPDSDQPSGTPVGYSVGNPLPTGGATSTATGAAVPSVQPHHAGWLSVLSIWLSMSALGLGYIFA